MGLTFAQAQALGIGHLHPAASGGKSPERELLDQLEPAPPKSRAPEDGLNKLERSFRDDVLEPAWARGDLIRFQREPFKVRLAGRTWYCPDFFVVERARGIHGAPRFVFIEVKGGFFRDDAKVKTKVAADLYPEFTWLLVTRPTRRDGWQVRRVTRTGISRETVSIEWIPGS